MIQIKDQDHSTIDQDHCVKDQDHSVEDQDECVKIKITNYDLDHLKDQDHYPNPTVEHPLKASSLQLGLGKSSKRSNGKSVWGKKIVSRNSNSDKMDINILLSDIKITLKGSRSRSL